MENFNKVLSFVLGLVVVIVFVIVLSGRLNLRSDLFTGKKNLTPTPTVKPTTTPTPKEEKSFFSRLFSRKTPTPTPTTKVLPSPTPVVITETRTQTTQKGGAQPVKEIPATGLPSLILPLFGSSALLGIYLRKRK